ncbi:uncharacterized protein LOC108859539 [Raphanus sativus]|uniref:Uncharacterized protein LOC108859539 n=1 Tax=Raphanus sativus TaxID=3726 RepID=A0A6J0NXF7_RAPSA|nr:uncharacterized protein LOC108859539 [Raphanus sativus]
MMRKAKSIVQKKKEKNIKAEAREATTAKMAKDSCLTRIVAGAAIGGAVGGAVGAVYGTYEAIRFKVPGLMKIRYIGQTTMGSAAIFGLFLGAGSLIHCGK